MKLQNAEFSMAISNRKSCLSYMSNDFKMTAQMYVLQRTKQ